MSSGTRSSGAGQPPNVPHLRLPSSRRDRIDRFTLEREIAEGGMAEVFVAWDNVLERPVVLKRMRPELAGPAGYARLRIEGFCLAQVRHPDVLTIYDAEFGDEHRPLREPYLVTEYVSGPTLGQFAASHRPIPGEVVGLVMGSLARTLAVAHQKRIVHRDVKPANVLVDLEQPGRLVLIDFNVAKVQGSDLRLTGRRERPGSPAYMSPEQTRAWRVDGRSDVFSLGILGYEFATGRLPFGPSEEEMLAGGPEMEREVMRRIRKGEYDAELLRRARLPGYVREAIERCLRVRRDERWQGAGELATFLEEHLGWDGLWPVREELKRYVTAPEAYESTLGKRVLDAVLAGARGAMQAGDGLKVQERMARAVEVMSPEEQRLWVEGLGRELSRREGDVKGGEGARSTEGSDSTEKSGGARGTEQQRETAGEEVPIPPVGTLKPPGQGEPEARSAGGWRATKRRWLIGPGPESWILLAAAAAVVVMLGALRWSMQRPEGALKLAPAVWMEAATFRRAIARMTDEQAISYINVQLKTEGRMAFDGIVQMLDASEFDGVRQNALLLGLARSDGNEVLDWMLEQIEQAPYRPSAMYLAQALGVLVQNRFQQGRLLDPRIVPSLVSMGEKLLVGGTAIAEPPVTALGWIAQQQRIPEAALLMGKVLARAEAEGEDADPGAVRSAALFLLITGGKPVAGGIEVQLRARPPRDRLRRVLEQALNEYSMLNMYIAYRSLKP